MLLYVRSRSNRHNGLSFFFFNDTATTEIYTLSLHDALPICAHLQTGGQKMARREGNIARPRELFERGASPRALRYVLRSEEHTSELQSRQYLVCRLLLEKKKKKKALLGRYKRLDDKYVCSTI